ncbi:MAG TPA: molybdopterin-dependent oxidoreductase, partial [Chroococcidiopsis sp.]
MLGKFFQKPEADQQHRVPPGQHLAKGFPVLTYGPTPEVNIQDWEFRISGLAKPLVLRWDDFMAMPQSNFTADFHCVTTWSKLDVSWTGIKVTDFMTYLEVDPSAVHLMQHCYGGYTTNIAL